MPKREVGTRADTAGLNSSSARPCRFLSSDWALAISEFKKQLDFAVWLILFS
jgi:hypothetical protein